MRTNRHETRRALDEHEKEIRDIQSSGQYARARRKLLGDYLSTNPNSACSVCEMVGTRRCMALHKEGCDCAGLAVAEARNDISYYHIIRTFEGVNQYLDITSISKDGKVEGKLR